MKIILINDVKNIGKKNDVKEVKDGYAKNFLIKNNLAIPYSETSMNQIKLANNMLLFKEIETQKDARELKEKLNNTIIRIKIKCSKDGKIFGSITKNQILNELLKLNLNVNKYNILLHDNIKLAGMHNIDVKIYKNEIATIKVLVEV